MAKSLIDDSLEALDRAADQAIQGTRRVLGEPNDPQVRFYESLDDKDLEFIRQTYGPEGMSRYVRAMEIRRARKA